MTTQQENYIESMLERFYDLRRMEHLDYVENKIIDDLELEDERERWDCEGKLFGAALEAHMKHFLEEKKEELFKYYMQEFEKDIKIELEEYRKELEAECEE